MTREKRNQITWKMLKQMAKKGTIHLIPTLREELPLLAQEIDITLEEAKEVVKLLYGQGQSHLLID